jgi:flagellum-specific peptidoglycan hydrolase FlgJ
MSTQTDFINLIKAGAQDSQKKYGILASLTIAQAADESGWGTHVIANNLFGIKANGSTGPCVTVGTKEFVGGEYINTTATFRAYPSLAASVEDQASFIASNARYKNILHITDAQKACELIQQDGYATDPDYATKLYDIIKEYKLTQYDTPTPTTAPVAAKHTEAVKQGAFFIRSTTNPLGGIVGTAKSGQTFITTILSSGWRQISYNGRTAYIGPAAFK